MTEAFNQRLIEALPDLRRFALFLCRDADLADDLVQTTVERAVRRRDSFDPATRLQAWLFRILRNAWIDTLRRGRSHGRHVDLDAVPELSGDDGDRATEARLMVRSTEAAIDDLPTEQREVIVLVGVEGLSYAEAAEVLGIPKGTVMSRLARARVALAERLGIT